MAESNGVADGSRDRRLLSFALYATLLTLKATLAFSVTDLGPDGSYYAEVARHVRDGHGLVSAASMYHAGAPSLPWPTPIYPVWPLLLGLVGRVVPLELAAVWLPTLLSFGAVALAARYARTLWSRPLLPGLWETPDAGHLAVVLLGFNPLFLEYSAQPYTEPLGFLLLFWALLRAAPLMRGEVGAARAFELGMYAGVLVLIRAQMFLFTLALAASFGVAALGWRPRGRWIVSALAAAGGWLVATAPQFAWLSTFHQDPFSLGALLRFERFRASDLMLPVEMLYRFDSPLAWLADRAAGFPIAYGGRGEFAYAQRFGQLHWAPMVALLAWAAPVRAAGLSGARAAIAHPRVGAFALFWIFALGGFFSLHTLHKPYGAEWNFATRHALTVLPLFAAGVVLAAARPGLPRVISIGLLGATLTTYWDEAGRLLRAADREIAGPATYRPGVLELLRRHERTHGPAVVASEKATRLTWELPDLSVYWVWEKTRFEDLDALFTHRGVDYLIIHKADPMDAFEDPRFPERFEQIYTDLSGMDVYRLRPPAAPLPGDTP